LEWCRELLPHSGILEPAACDGAFMQLVWSIPALLSWFLMVPRGPCAGPIVFALTLVSSSPFWLYRISPPRFRHSGRPCHRERFDYMAWTSLIDSRGSRAFPDSLSKILGHLLLPQPWTTSPPRSQLPCNLYLRERFVQGPDRSLSDLGGPQVDR